jgi:agmatinase
MLNKNILNFIGCDSEYEDAAIVLYGAPFDSTTSFRPGTRFAGQAIRSESYGLETYSPYQDKDLEDYDIFDSGDLELAIGDSGKVLEAIRERASVILKDHKLPFLIGGEHLVTLGAVRAAVESYPDLHIIHFDAHTDLREDYLGVELSHACVLRRCWELVGDGRIHQFGIRSGERQEFQWAREGHTDLHPFRLDGLKETIEALKGKPVYFTLDLDVLDPSFFPGTGTPEPGGISFLELLEAVQIVCGGAQVIGCDVNELSPPYDASGVSTAVACKIIREMLLALLK